MAMYFKDDLPEGISNSRGQPFVGLPGILDSGARVLEVDFQSGDKRYLTKWGTTMDTRRGIVLNCTLGARFGVSINMINNVLTPQLCIIMWPLWLELTLQPITSLVTPFCNASTTW